MPVWCSFKPNQTNPDCNTSRENDKFYPIPRTVKLHCYPLFQSALCRPLRVLTLNILLMEGKWSRSDCGQLGHWAEADDSHLFLSLPEAVQYVYFLNISGLKSAACGPVGSVEERVYMMFDMAVNADDKLMWCSKVWQQEVYEKEGGFRKDGGTPGTQCRPCV